MAKKIYEVEVKGQKQKFAFATKAAAEAYAITATAWVGGKYRINAYIVSDAKAELFEEIEKAQDFIQKVSGVR
jgi:predicted butyrate kinase (DUF1464 family)